MAYCLTDGVGSSTDINGHFSVTRSYTLPPVTETTDIIEDQSSNTQFSIYSTKSEPYETTDNSVDTSSSQLVYTTKTEPIHTTDETETSSNSDGPLTQTLISTTELGTTSSEETEIVDSNTVVTDEISESSTDSSTPLMSGI